MNRRAFSFVVLTVVAALSATVLAASLGLQTQPSEAPQASRQSVLWSGNDVGNVPRISPDGRMLVYIDRRQPGVAIRDLTTGTNRLIVRAVTDGPRDIIMEAAGEVVFSPDGRRVAYSWAKFREDVYEVRITPVADTGGTRVVATMTAGASIKLHDWSEDGRWIAAERSDASAAAPVDYLLINAADGTSRVVQTTRGRAPTSRLVFSPDGRHLAYDRPAFLNAAQHDVFLLSVDTGTETGRIASPADESTAGWSPDGQHLLITREANGFIDLLGQPVADGTPSGLPRTLQGGIEGAPIGMTANGGLLMVANADAPAIYSVDVNPDTGAVLSPPIRLSDQRWSASWGPEFSADGQRITYLSRVLLGPGAGIGGPTAAFLSIKSLDTGQTTVLAPRLWSGGYSWLPDGRTLLAAGSDLQNRYGVHLVDAARGTTTPLAIADGVFEGTRFTGPQVARSGRRVYYNRTPRGGPSVREAARAGRASVAPIHAIMERDLDTGEERVFLAWSEVRTTDGAAFAAVRNVQVSPDDQWVAALATVSGSAGQLWVVSVKDKSARALPLELESGPFPISNDIKWTPDGRAILVNLRQGTGREATRSLWLVPVDGSKPARLPIDMPIAELAATVHPDGFHIAFVSGGTGTREVRLLENVLAPQSTAGPVIAFDEAHRNPPSAATPALFELLRAEGYRPRALTQQLSAASLKDVNVLVINCPGGLTALELARARRLPDAAAEAQAAALNDDEIAAVVAWLETGGSVLLVVDHAPYPLAAAKLTAALGIRNWGGGAVRTDLCTDPGPKPACMAPDADGNPRAGNIFFWRKDFFPGGEPRLVEIPGEGGFRPSSGYQAADAVLARHPITEGRGPNERIQRVVVFGGSAFEAPPGAEPLLTLPPRGASSEVWLQGAAMQVGKGRLAVFADNAVVSPGNAGDNRQFVLNVMHWLSRVL